MTRNRKLWKLPLFLAAFSVALTACEQSAPAPSPALEVLAPLVNLDHPQRVAGSYIVVMKPGLGVQSAEPQVAQIARLRYRYTLPGFQGFSVQATASELEQLRRQPGVAYIEADAVATGSQTSSPWGLDRVDQRQLPFDGRYQSGTKTGAGVRVYVLDSGIRATHAEFGGRVGKGFSAISDGLGTRDCQGHGTHVAAIIGGKTYGVAKRVTLVPVRVLDCQKRGSTSEILAGIAWVSSHALRPAVANMSLNFRVVVRSVDEAIRASIKKGIPYVVAAGNTGADACTVSPSSVAEAIVVGASGMRDVRAPFSNYGSCVDMFAPGQNIRSAVQTSDTATAIKFGTSMAAPHVAGAVALLGAPREAERLLRACSTKGVVKSAGSADADLLYVGCGR